MKPVFLVDDSPTMLASMSAVLRKAGLVVETAPNAEAALARLVSQPPLRMMVVDLNMPGMNGIQLIAEVRKLPTYRFVPILMLTTETAQLRRDEARRAGATGWLVKPATPDKLLQVIHQVAPV